MIASAGATLEELLHRLEARGALDRAAGGALLDVAAGVKAISLVLARAALAGVAGDAPGENPHGERQKKMDVLANALLLDAVAEGGHVAAIASEELASPHPVPGAGGGGLLLAMDPLDGSSNLDANVTVGTIFSLWPRPAGAAPCAAAFLQPGARQVCAGYALYGPCTTLVLAAGGEVNGLTLDPAGGELVLTHPRLRFPEEALEYGIDGASARHWERPVRRYVDECVAGRGGAPGADLGMRWVGTPVADVHRALVRGGTALYPRGRGPAQPGGLRLLYAAAPLALVVEQAGGAASTGRARLLEVVPRELHERVPALLGSRREVERLVRYHAEHDGGLDRPYTSPLFSPRSLLREW